MIQIKNLNFSYEKGNNILNNVSFEVPKGSIFGFLGGNGAGKTTTIRIMLGLCKANSGTITINDKPLSELDYRNVGALIEEPTLYPNLSGKENLQLLSKYYNVSDERIDEVLQIVGLENTKDKKTKNYSLGMKQRLGIAQSLFHNPEILILDEPLNGLDPNGIKEIRDLMFKLRDEGKTIFVSSHILSEVEKSCDCICIINKGSIVLSDKIENLQNILSKEIEYLIECNDIQQAQKILSNEIPVIINENNSITIKLPNDKIVATYLKLLITDGIDIYQVRKKENSLEDIFLQTTK